MSGTGAREGFGGCRQGQARDLNEFMGTGVDLKAKGVERE